MMMQKTPEWGHTGHADKNRRPRHNESGNVFFLIFLGVALFAALIYSFSRSTQQGAGNLSEMQARMAASELISQSQTYQRALDRLLRRGCSENQISFEGNDMLQWRNGDPVVYTNASSPADQSCHMFSSHGGGASPFRIPADYVVDNSQVCPNCIHAQSMHFTSLRVVGHGSDATTANGSDLVMWMGRVNRNVCLEINDQLGIENPGDAPPIDPWDCDNENAPYTGSFADCADPIGGGTSVLAGKGAFCVGHDSSGLNYIFMTVLLPR